MNKEEILEKSRNSHEDEGDEHAINKGLTWGLAWLSATFAIIGIFCLIFSRENLAPSYAASTMLWAFLCAYYIPQYRFSKNKRILIASIGYGIALLASFAALVITVVTKNG